MPKPRHWAGATYDASHPVLRQRAAKPRSERRCARCRCYLARDQKMAYCSACYAVIDAASVRFLPGADAIPHRTEVTAAKLEREAWAAALRWLS